MQTAVMTDTECIQNIHAIYGSELEGLDDNMRLEAIALLALVLRFGWSGCHSGRMPMELLAHIHELTPKGMRTLINCLNCAPRQSKTTREPSFIGHYDAKADGTDDIYHPQT